MRRSVQTPVRLRTNVLMCPGNIVVSRVRSIIASLALGIVMSTAMHAQFTLISTPSVVNARNGSAVWGDCDGDDDLDLLVTGRTSTGGSTTALYDGSTFGAPTVSGFSSFGSSGTGRNRSAWGDFDRDGDLDVVITGEVSGTPTMTLYRNNGTSFAAVTVGPVPFTGISNSAVAWGDLDNDGDLDLFASGTTATGRRATVYRNDGASGTSWLFRDIVSCMFDLAHGDAAWGDVDRDGDLDLAVTGEMTQYNGAGMASVYMNHHGVLMEDQQIGGVERSALAWGDYDNDGDLDLALTGIDPYNMKSFAIYENTAGTLSMLPTPTGVTPVTDGSVAWGDYDNDGDLDLLVTGLDDATTPAPITEVFRQTSTPGVFTAASAGLPGLYDGMASWGDYDKDGYLDIVLTGNDGTGPRTAIYRNTLGNGPNAVQNSAPSAPTGLTRTLSWRTATITWNAATDGQTPSAGLTYNLSLIDASNNRIVTSMSNTSNGFRRLPALGNTSSRTGSTTSSWTITNLTPGATYTACVQAVDGAMAGSAFACTTFTLPPSGPGISIRDCSGDGGLDPNLTGCMVGSPAQQVLWASPNIWVRHTNDGLTTHQNPISTDSNFVYVRLHNHNSTAGSGTVQVFFSRAATGLGWPRDWVDKYTNTSTPRIEGDYIGSAYVTVPAPTPSSNGTVVVAIPWYDVPEPSDFNNDQHFCLLARFNGFGDAITKPEVTDVFTTVQQNSNFAWKNITIIDDNGPSPIIAPIDINNPFTTVEAFDLRFFVDDPEDSFLDHGAIVFDLGEALFDRWEQGGLVGEGIELYTREDGTTDTKIRIVAENAWIGNITLPPDRRLTANGIFDAKYHADVAGRVYQWHIAQHLQDEAQPIGGETYDITMPTSEAEGVGKGVIIGSAAEDTYRLDARPNPTNSTATISYTLPAESRVTLTIYDANGHLVRRLIEEAVQSKGSYQSEWDGMSLSGAPVPAGTYIYRLESEGRSIERKLVIVR